MAKQSLSPFPYSFIQSKNPFELKHNDIWGPYSTATLTGASYFLTIVDDFITGTWTYLMAYKSQTTSMLTKFLTLVNTQFHSTAKTIRTDNGLEFSSQACQSLFINHGIMHHRTCPCTPQQNGVVERKHRYLLQITRALMLQSCLPKIFGERHFCTLLFSLIVYLQNFYLGRPRMKCYFKNN